jgi:hypothetical protein
MNIKELETAVINLPPTEFAEFAEWFEEYQAKAWDTQIEDDLKKGRLDHLLSEATADFEDGRCKPL